MAAISSEGRTSSSACAAAIVWTGRGFSGAAVSATALASVAVLNMDDAGEQASAAAMGIMIVLTAGGARLLHAVLTRDLARRTQAWRKR